MKQRCIYCNSTSITLSEETAKERVYSCNHCHNDNVISKFAIGLHNALRPFTLSPVKANMMSEVVIALVSNKRPSKHWNKEQKFLYDTFVEMQLILKLDEEKSQ